jgi:hypothetical protein
MPDHYSLNTDEDVTSIQTLTKEGTEARSTEIQDSLSANHEECYTYFTPPTSSQTPAAQFEEKSDSELKQKVTKLILDLFPGYCHEDVKLECMQSESYNRVIGITLYKSPPKLPWYTLQGIISKLSPCLTGRSIPVSKPQHFILHIPRHVTQNLHHQVTTLAYLSHRLPYPVPKVIVFDSSPENALGQAYLLQERLPGRPLSDLWPTLNRTQKLSCIRAISHILVSLHDVKNKCPGTISVKNTTYDIKHDMICTEQIPIPSLLYHTTGAEVRPSNPQTTKDFLLDLCARHTAHTSPATAAIWTRITKMIHVLHTLNLISDSDPFRLYHGGAMHPRSLLLETTSSTSVAITGILNWDHALFAPPFLSTCAPGFLWGASEDDEMDDLVRPEHEDEEEKREAKKEFEKVVGREFAESAFRVELMLMRRLWGVLQAGFTCGADVWMVEDVLNEFSRYHSLD